MRFYEILGEFMTDTLIKPATILNVNGAVDSLVVRAEKVKVGYIKRFIFFS